MFWIVAITTCVSAAYIPAAVHTCRDDYKGQPDPFCSMQFTTGDMFCWPYLRDLTQYEEAIANSAPCRLHPANARLQMLPSPEDNTQNLFDQGSKFRVQVISNVYPGSPNPCMPGTVITLAVAGVSWLPGYVGCVQNYKTGVLVPGCRFGQFGSACQIQCTPPCSSHGTCVYKPNMLNPQCLCDPGWVGRDCSLSWTECMTTVGSASSSICADRGLCRDSASAESL